MHIQLESEDGGERTLEQRSLFGLPRSMGDADMQARVEGPNEPLFVWLN